MDFFVIKKEKITFLIFFVLLGQLQNAVSMVFCPIVICSEYLWYYMQVCTAYGIIYQHAVSNEYGIIYQYAVIIQ